MGTKYRKEFKDDALRLAAGESVAAASEKLGIAKRQIYEWRRDQRLASVKAPKGLKTGETLEECCHRLEKERDELREANYILKKAMGFLVGR